MPTNVLLAIGASGIGGGQKVFLSFAEELHRRGCRVVAVLPAGPLVELVTPFAKSVYVADLGSVRSFPRILRILRNEPVDIVNTYLTKCGLLFGVANVLSRRRLVCTLLNAVTHEALGPIRRRAYPVLYWLLHRLSDGIIVNSEQNKRHMVDVVGMDPGRIKVIYSGIDVEGFSGQHEPSATNDQFILGAVGRLSQEKGHVYLLRAMGLVRHLDCTCLLVGDGPLRHELERVAIEEGVADRVRFLGFQEDVASVMRRMDVVVVPSLDETFGISIVEAFALKKPVIASDVGGIPELVRHGETGILVSAKDSVALAGAIDYAFSHRSECERMGRNGYERAVTTFTTAVMAEETLKYFEAVIGASGGGERS